ncbi:hypothetical protein [Nocardioides sp.]|uniref:hypothetical protein n=1 Tax=Nocardioides sp. TaxID=35761 RepID=UPI002B268A16|nr:hypothetical protein [Nocardioides sp.]
MPSADRQGKRGHENGNVRPADGRYGLHDPSEESQVIRTPTTATKPSSEDKPAARKAKR